MDWHTYKTLSDRPDYWSRWMICQCADLLTRHNHAALAAALSAALDGEALPQPADFKGPQATHMFQLTLSGSQRQQALATIAAAREAQAKTADGRGLGGFVEAWQEYVDFEDAHR